MSDRRSRSWYWVLALILGAVSACGSVKPTEQADADPGLSCPAPLQPCGDDCVDLDTSIDNCGACSESCGEGLVCGRGSCGERCPDGQESCDGSCVNLLADPRHCGACDRACSAGDFCGSGVCTALCPVGTETCGSVCVALENDVLNCGACGRRCLPNQVCGAGACISACPGGQEDCDGSCVNTNTDENHCGACGETCAAAQECRQGICVSTTSCSDDQRNGAETGVDCGGPTTCAACPVGEGCLVGNDCQSNACAGGTCCAPNANACAERSCGMVTNNCGQQIQCGACHPELACRGDGQCVGDWTNQPAGTALIVDCPFASVAGCGIFDVYGTSEILVDEAAPFPDARVMVSTIHAGNSAGGVALSHTTALVYREMYVGMMWRTNAQFGGRPSGNQLFAVRGPQQDGFFSFGAGALVSGGAAMVFMPGGGAAANNCGDSGSTCYPNASPGTLTVGRWTKLEVYVKAATSSTSRDGIVRWWIDGDLAGEYTSLNYAPGGLNEWAWSENWNGTVAPVPSSDWRHYVDNLRIAAR